jgi:hypothetical protein
MMKAGISLQGLQDKIGIGAEFAPGHRLWGLYVHVKKMEARRTDYLMAGATWGTGRRWGDLSSNRRQWIPRILSSVATSPVGVVDV